MKVFPWEDSASPGEAARPPALCFQLQETHPAWGHFTSARSLKGTGRPARLIHCCSSKGILTWWEAPISVRAMIPSLWFRKKDVLESYERISRVRNTTKPRPENGTTSEERRWSNFDPLVLPFAHLCLQRGASIHATTKVGEKKSLKEDSNYRLK